MSNRNYATGRDYEYKERDYWREKGWYAQRSHGSKGPWDVYAVSPDGKTVYWIQVKTYRNTRPDYHDDVVRLKELPAGPASKRLLVIYGPRRKGRKTPRRAYEV